MSFIKRDKKNGRLLLFAVFGYGIFIQVDTFKPNSSNSLRSVSFIIIIIIIINVLLLRFSSYWQILLLTVFLNKTSSLIILLLNWKSQHNPIYKTVLLKAYHLRLSHFIFLVLSPFLFHSIFFRHSLSLSPAWMFRGSIIR